MDRYGRLFPRLEEAIGRAWIGCSGRRLRDPPLARRKKLPGRRAARQQIAQTRIGPEACPYRSRWQLMG
jgi:hypothetical protein